LASAMGLIATSVYLGHLPLITAREVTPIFLLYALFFVVKGLEKSALLSRISAVLERGSFLAPKLVVITFLLSVAVTIDVSLVTILPIVLTLRIKEKNVLAILVALTAHVGAALTPFGTPQNLFIYSYFDVPTIDFIRSIAPFSLGLAVLFFISAFFIRTTPESTQKRKNLPVEISFSVIYLVLLVIVILCVLHLLPLGMALSAILFALLFDQRSLKIDYALLLIFLIFIGLASNIKAIIGSEISHPGHIFLLSAMMSQFISNVPTTLLLDKFTSQWEALLWGTNVGGFGSLVAAMANLITYRIYMTYGESEKRISFMLYFIGAGYLAFFAGLTIYFLFKHPQPYCRSLLVTRTYYHLCFR